MLYVILYVLALLTLMAVTYNFRHGKLKIKKDNTRMSISMIMGKKQNMDILTGLNIDHRINPFFETINDSFICMNDFLAAAETCMLSEINIMIGIDFSASNEWQGRKSFNNQSLHRASSTQRNNPYCKVLSAMAQVLDPYLNASSASGFRINPDVEAYAFGDAISADYLANPIKINFTRISSFQEIVDWYLDYLKNTHLKGPSSFAPLITQAIRNVESTFIYTLLVIISDGRITEDTCIVDTVESLIEASDYPIGIAMVGVGDGPWDLMHEFDDNLPQRTFDNFRFIDFQQIYSKMKKPEHRLVAAMLSEVPAQYELNNGRYAAMMGFSRVDQSPSITADSKSVK